MKQISTENLAVVMLACRDHEAMEVALACHMKYSNPNVSYFILQNCVGYPNATRTLQVARRYQALYPRRITIIDGLGQRKPYFNIKRLLQSKELANFDYILKVDDDAFPIAPNWLEELMECWTASERIHGNRLAYVTPLINNNNWGFKRVMEILDLEDEYFTDIAYEIRVGAGSASNPYRTLAPTQIETGANGTIWASPRVARWLHDKTTLEPQFFIDGCAGLGSCNVPSFERYSIGAILFPKPLWVRISNGGRDDEHMLHQYCAQNDLIIICQQSVPFVHLNYFTHRNENQDIVGKARDIYQQFTGIEHPIGRDPHAPEPRVTAGRSGYWTVRRRQFVFDARFMLHKILLHTGLRKSPPSVLKPNNANAVQEK